MQRAQLPALAHERADRPIVERRKRQRDGVVLLRGDVHEVVSLLTTVSEEYRRISHHRVREALLEEQAKAVGLPLRKVLVPSGSAGGCTNEVYEAIMGEVMLAYHRDGVRTVAFGDLFLQDLRDWREANLAKAGMRGIFPIWSRASAEFAREVIALGYKARLSCVEGRLGAGFAGREYDEKLLRDLPVDVDPCGENGEFHSFVYDGADFPVRDWCRGRRNCRAARPILRGPRSGLSSQSSASPETRLVSGATLC